MLAALVAVLCQQVYTVAYKPKEDEAAASIFKPPKGNWQPAAELDVPPSPPLLPDRPDAKRMLRRNPFSADGLDSSGEAGGVARPDLVVVRIVPWTGGTHVAEIRTQTARPKRYGVGDAFEAYKIISIDPDAKEVVIYSEEHRSNFTYTAP